MKYNHFRNLSLAAIVISSLASCSKPYYESGEDLDTPTTPKAIPFTYYEWNGAGVEGKLKMAINLSTQKATLTKNGKNVGWTYVATGKSTHPTPTGTFKISEKKADKTSNKYGYIINAAGEVIDEDAAAGREKVAPGCKYIPAPMPNWQRLTSFGVGMHAGNIPTPGSPASHGCIRLPLEMSKILFEETSVGTPVTITRY